MRRLLTWAGVDVDQWKALTAVALKLDFRVTALGQRQFGRETQMAAGLLFQAFFYTLFGGIIAFFVWVSRDLFLVGTVASTYTAFIVGTAVILDHNSVISSPNDYAILGFRPVSSRTYFAVKLTNILVYTTALTMVAAWLPIVSAVLRHGAAIGVALTLDIFATSTATTLAIALGYASVLRIVGPDAIDRALSYVQIVMSFAVYGGQLVMSRIVSTSAMMAWTLPKTPWLLLYPGTWFASYLELAAGDTSVRAVIPAVTSLVFLALMATKLGGRLSLEYSERLGAMTAAARVKAHASSRGGRTGPWFTAGEARAAAMLIRSQFRHDHRFRMGVLGLLPFTLLYMWLGIRDGAIVDPFTAGQGMQAWPVTIAILTAPAMLRMQPTHSDAFRASWIFFACPSDRMKIARASKDVLVVYFLIPYLLLVLAVYTYVVGRVGHVLVHIVFLGLLAHLVLQLALLLDPSLPFSKPIQKGRGTSLFFVFTMGTVLISGFIHVYSARLYSSVATTGAAVASILVAGALIDRLTRARVERQTQLLEFQG